MKHKPNSAFQQTPTQELEANKQSKDSLYSDMIKRKRNNTVIRRKSSETNIQPKKRNTIQILKLLTENQKSHLFNNLTKGKQLYKNKMEKMTL